MGDEAVEVENPGPRWHPTPNLRIPRSSDSKKPRKKASKTAEEVVSSPVRLVVDADDNPVLTAREVQLAIWDSIVGQPRQFVENPPLRFQYETSHGRTMIVRLMLNSYQCISWNIELQHRDAVRMYWQLYYWKEPCPEQRGFNEENLLRLNSRWSDNMTHLRHSDAIDTYNFITEMLMQIGIDEWETIG